MSLSNAMDKNNEKYKLDNISVVAGHFFWDVWQELPNIDYNISEKKNGYVNKMDITVLDSIANCTSNGNCDGSQVETPLANQVKVIPPCFILGRHPFDRAISYYYQRCYDSAHCIGYQRMFNNLTVNELYHITTSERQAKYKQDNKTLVIIDEGMEDAACRALANVKVTTGYIVENFDPLNNNQGASEMKLPPPLNEMQINTAMKNIDYCVVGILEKWNETKKIIEYWFPWIQFNNDTNRRKMFLYSNKEVWSDLRPELIEVLKQVSKCDLILYEKMLRIFEKEMKVLNVNVFGIT